MRPISHNTATHACPLAHYSQDWADYKNPVVFELRRVKSG
jgi:hypothetical protein